MNRVNSSSPSMSFPSFLGIGAPQSGSTWLYRQLDTHPDIWLAPVKEIHYFDRQSRFQHLYHYTSMSINPFMRLIRADNNIKKRVLHGLLYRLRSFMFAREISAYVRWMWQYDFGDYTETWYRNLFSNASAYVHRGEITPAYSILHIEDVLHIRDINPDVKLIMLLRNPIHRTWSAIRRKKDVGMISFELNETERVIELIRPGPMMKRSDYLNNIDTYLKVFEPSQLLVGFYDAIEENPLGLLNTIADFLNVSASGFQTSRIADRVNASTKFNIPAPIHEYLSSEFAEMLEGLASRLGSYAVGWLGETMCTGNASNINSTKFLLPPAVHPKK